MRKETVYKFYLTTGREVSFYVEIQLKKQRNYITLNEEDMVCYSSCQKDRKGRGGKDQRSLMKYLDKIKEEDKELFILLHTFWEKYHFNGYSAGTYNQSKFVEKWSSENPFNYDKLYEALKENNLYIDNEYQYGTDWLCRPIPKEDLDKILKLFN